MAKTRRPVSYYPCGTPKRSVNTRDAASNHTNGAKPAKAKRRKSAPAAPGSAADQLMGKPMEVKPVNEAEDVDEIIRHCLPAFGGAHIRRIYDILHRVIGEGVPLIIAIAGPVTVSNQHRAWLIPLLRTGAVAYITVTDAACYHDGHDSLQAFRQRPIREVQIEGMDEEYRRAGIIRVTDAGFPEDLLFKQDEFFTALFRQPELQRKMTGTEFRNIVGKYYQAMEKQHGIAPGLLSTCYEMGIPVFVGAPGDGSAYLNHVKLWALAQRGILDHKFELDVAGEVFESCAYHYWGLFSSKPKKLAVLILGGGVPKNFTLQPEPTLSQIFLLDGIRGYDFDVQIVGAPVTDGSLTSCKPAEAHTWGKVSAEALQSTVESYQTDYSTVMPFIVRGLLDEVDHAGALVRKLGRAALNKRYPELAGFADIAADPGLKAFRLFAKRDALVRTLLDAVTTPKQVKRLKATMNFKLPKV